MPGLCGRSIIAGVTCNKGLALAAIPTVATSVRNVRRVTPEADTLASSFTCTVAIEGGIFVLRIGGLGQIQLLEPIAKLARPTNRNYPAKSLLRIISVSNRSREPLSPQLFFQQPQKSHHFRMISHIVRRARVAPRPHIHGDLLR